VEYLADAQLALGRALIAAVGSVGSADARSALDALGAFDRQSPSAVGRVLTHPYLRVWAVEALTRAEHGDLELADDLGCVAAAVAVRAGLDVEVPVRVRGGAVHLPSVGSIAIPRTLTGQGEMVVKADSVTVRVAGEQVSVDTGEPWGSAWQPNRWVTMGGDLTVLVEDLDPYRDAHDWKADGRLSESTAREWGELLRSSWSIVEQDAPGQAPAVRAGLRAVTPLVADPGGLLRSSTTRHAFGSVGAAPASPSALAVMLVHEFQHTVLGALLDLCDLFDSGYRRHLRVAWRTDLRPIEGVLQGTFAHLSVADMWRARVGRDGADEQAVATYRQYRDWTAAAIDVLTASGGLTADGDRFVAGMAATLASFDR
jgi:uncharacterized protein